MGNYWEIHLLQQLPPSVTSATVSKQVIFIRSKIHSRVDLPKSEQINMASMRGFPGGSAEKNPPANTGDAGLIPGSGRFPGGGNCDPVQFSLWLSW